MNTTTPADPASRLRRWGPTLIAVPALLVLLGLGTWQVQRLHWKEALIAQQATQLRRPPVAVSEIPASGEGFRFRRVTARGRLEHGAELRVAPRTHKGAAGAHVVTPLRLDDGSVVLINRGWLPARLADPASRPAGQVAGPVTVTGILRMGGRPSRWVPDNRPETGEWHYIDVAAMTAHARAKPVRNYYIEAGPAANPGGYPIGGQTPTRLRNDHLQYAMTWYGLAAALAAIYILYQRRRIRST